MTDHSRSGGSVRPQSVVGPIALDKTRSAPIPVQPNSVVGPVALGLVAPVAIIEATCSPETITLVVESNAGRTQIVIAAPAGGTAIGPVAAGSTLNGIARNDTDLMILLDGATPQVFFTVPVGTAEVTVTVGSGPAI